MGGFLIECGPARVVVSDGHDATVTTDDPRVRVGGEFFQIDSTRAIRETGERLVERFTFHHLPTLDQPVRELRAIYSYRLSVGREAE